MQRRLGLAISDLAPIVLDLARVGVTMDSLGDDVIGDPKVDNAAPHNAALMVWHEAAVAKSVHSVVLGDKTNKEVYDIYNVGHVVDLAETLMGDGGGDLCVELKCYSSIIAAGASLDSGVTPHGDTHAFGNVEEGLIRTVMGVLGREGDRPWDPAAGAGKVAAHSGDYADALAKGNTVALIIHNLFGGFAPGAVAYLRRLAARAGDRTEHRGSLDFTTFYAQRLSAAVVTADARRCRRILGHLRDRARDAAALRARQIDAMIADGRRAAERRARDHPSPTGLAGDAAHAPAADSGA